MIQGKSYTRRYWEDLLERFEEEGKWIDSQKKLDEEKERLFLGLNTAHEKRLLSGEELQRYLQRVREVKLHDERVREYKEQVINLNDDVMTARERLLLSTDAERKTLSLSDLKSQINDRIKEGENAADSNGLKGELHIDQTEEKGKEVKSGVKRKDMEIEREIKI